MVLGGRALSRAQVSVGVRESLPLLPSLSAFQSLQCCSGGQLSGVMMFGARTLKKPDCVAGSVRCISF